MFSTKRLIALSALALIGCSGADDVVDYPEGESFLSAGKADVTISVDGEVVTIVEGSDEAKAILKVCNDATGSDGIDFLDDTVGLYNTEAKNIVNRKYLSSADTSEYGQDFESLDQLDDISYTGVHCFKTLYVYARDNGLFDSGNNGGGSNGGGSSGGYVSFDQRIINFQTKYSSRVKIAKRRSRPVIFVKTSDISDEETAKKLFNDLLKTMGTNTLMSWNPEDENYFHAGMGLGANTKLDDKFKGKATNLYSRITFWDATKGNMDKACYDDETPESDEDNTYRIYNQPCFKSQQLDLQRTVVLTKLTNTQLTEWNSYLNAILDDFSGTLGPTIYNGETPPYFLDSFETDPDFEGGHNCTSWFTTFLHCKVSTDYGLYNNPADHVNSVWGKFYESRPDGQRGFLIFNHPDHAQITDGQPLSTGFSLEVGY